MPRPRVLTYRDAVEELEAIDRQYCAPIPDNIHISPDAVRAVAAHWNDIGGRDDVLVFGGGGGGGGAINVLEVGTNISDQIQITGTVHDVKSWSPFFQAIKRGHKVHDLRKNDRDYRVGDQIVLREYLPFEGRFTGDTYRVLITYITNNDYPCAYSSHALDRGYAILSIKPWS